MPCSCKDKNNINITKQPCSCKDKKQPCSCKDKKQPCSCNDKKQPCSCKDKKQPCSCKDKKQPCSCKDKKQPCSCKDKIGKNDTPSHPSTPSQTLTSSQIVNNTANSINNIITVDFQNNYELKYYVKQLKIPSKIRHLLKDDANNKSHQPCVDCNDSVLMLKYFLSIKKYYIKSIICINIPSYVKNFYQLRKFINHIQKHHLILPEIIKQNRLKDLPTFSKNGDTTVVSSNYNAFLEENYKQYLTNNNLKGSIITQIV